MRYFLVLLLIFPAVYLFSTEVQFVEKDFQNKIENTKQLPIYEYPYKNLPDQLKKMGKKDIILFTYGSLISYTSANKTLSKKTLETRKPAVAFGIRRVFDRDVPIRKGSKWKLTNDEKARGMLNVIDTHNSFDMVNGVIVNVPIEELNEILIREVGYDLVPVLCIDWDLCNSSSPESYIAYTFRAKQKSQYTSQNIKPRPGYYELVRDAAKEYGPLFYTIWINTTYCSDGNTSIRSWEKAWKEGKKFTQAKEEISQEK
jgi:hypothetical protein